MLTSSHGTDLPAPWQPWAAWHGRAEDLAEAAARILSAWGRPDDAGAANLRVVRDYAARGVLGRPNRAGKEALFGVRALVEFLAARFLLADGWPLAKIAEFTAQATLAELVARLPEPPARTAAEAALDALAAREVGLAEFAAGAPAVAASAPAPAPLQMERSLHRTARLGKPLGPPRERLLRLRLAAWCEVLIEPDAARRLSPEDADALAASLAEALRTERMRQGGS